MRACVRACVCVCVCASAAPTRLQTHVRPLCFVTRTPVPFYSLLFPSPCIVPTLQYVPYALDGAFYGTDGGGKGWESKDVRDLLLSRVLGRVERACPGFGASIAHVDMLTPYDLERVFGIHRGNIFHGSLVPHQIMHMRTPYRTPIDGLWLGGAGTHPGGGVMGAPGYNCAHALLASLGVRPP